MTVRLFRKCIIPLLLVVVADLPGAAQAPSERAQQAVSGDFRLIGKMARGGAGGMVAIRPATDDRRLYGLSFDGTLRYFDRKSNLNDLELSGSFGSRRFEGLSHLDIAANGRYLAMTSVVTRIVALVRLDGRFIQSSSEIGPTVKGLTDWLPRESVFSPDSRFLYAADDRGAIHVFRVTTDGKLEWSQSFRGLSDLSSGTISIVVHPDGATVFAVDRRSGRLLVLDRDAATGALAMRQSLSDGESSTAGLGSAVDLELSADGRFLYVSSGDRRGDFAISVFQVFSQGKVRLIQELVDDARRLRDACSGDGMAISPDGRMLVRCSKLRDTIVRFDRDVMTGRLTHPQVLFKNEEKDPLWVTGPSFAADGTLYVATELRNGLLVFGSARASAPEAPVDSGKPASPVGAGAAAASHVADPKSSGSVKQSPSGTRMPIPVPMSSASQGTSATVPTIGAAGERKLPRFRSAISPNPPGIAKNAVFTGHTGPVRQAVFSPDGQRIASCSDDKTVRVWYVARRTEQFVLKASAGGVDGVAWSPDGRILAAAAPADRTIILWDADTGRELRRFHLETFGAYCVAFCADGKQLLSAGSDGVLLWDVANGKKLKSFEHRLGNVQCLSISPDGSLALCGGIVSGDSRTAAAPAETLRVWRLSDGEVVFRLQPTIPLAARNAFFSANGKSIVAFDAAQHGLGVWDVFTGKPLRILQARGYLNEGDLAAALGRSAAVTTNIRSHDLWLCDIESGDIRLVLHGLTSRAQTIAVSPDGRHVAASGNDTVLYLWELPEPAKLPPSPPVQFVQQAGASAPTVAEEDRLSGHKGYISRVAFAPDGGRVASCSDDGTLKIWDIQRRAEIHSIKASEHGLNWLSWSRDGKHVAVGGVQGTISLWDSETGRPLKQFTNLTGFLRGFAFSPDGSTLLTTGSGGMLRRLNLADGKETESYQHEIGFVNGVAFSPDGRTVLAYGAGPSSSRHQLQTREMLRVWNVGDGKTVFKLQSRIPTIMKSAVYAPDGKFIAAEDFDASRTIGIYELATGERTKTVPRGLSTIGDLAFLPGGRYLLIAHIDGVVALHDLALEQPIRYFGGAEGVNVKSLAVSPDGRTILGGGSDRVIRIWRTPEIALPKP